MSSNWTMTHPRPRSFIGSAEPSPPRRHSKAVKTSNRDMDLDSIRARRARLKALTASVRLPPLTPSEALGTRRSSIFSPLPHRNLPSGDRHLQHRQKPELTQTGRTSATSVRIHSGTILLPELTLPPMTPHHDPLPQIGQTKMKWEVEEKKGDGDDSHLDDAKIDSPPPPTYEDTLKVSQWVENIPPEAMVEFYPSLKSPDTREPSPDTAEVETSAALTQDNSSESPPKSPENSSGTDVDENVDYAKIVADMGSENDETKLEATVKVRKLISTNSNPPIDEFLEAGLLIPTLANLQEKNSTLVYETAWIITNISSGNSSQTSAVVEQGFIKPLVQLLREESSREVQEQAVWAIGNIVGDSADCRNEVVAAGVINPLLSLISPDIPVSLTRNIAWAVSNLFRSKAPKMGREEQLLVLKSLKDHLILHPDMVVRVDALWATSYYTDLGNEYIQDVLDVGLVPMLLQYLQSGERREMIPALRTLGSITSGTDAQTQVVLEAGILPISRTLLTTNSPTNIQKDTAWAVSNILAGPFDQIQMVIDADLLPVMVEASQKFDFIVKKEISWGFSNMTQAGTKEHIEALVSVGGVTVLVDTLSSLDQQVVLAAAEGIKNILEKSDDVNSIAEMIEECNGVEYMETNLQHENPQVYNLINEILDTYFKVPKSPSVIQDDENTIAEAEQNLPEKASKYVADIVPQSFTSG
ncbi:importin subunit alpha-4-like isoform X2 [Homarus americanus]|uniref:importin subunit alpha-4-like isoform X2 n=1 Tax=Homarus americanus TaxID=6706 RepID=UPI001C45F8B8|nr:importin subunit alpha-4-like isoform X2 [Homarus americanus]